MTTEERDVVVVGAGPVGLTIASALDYYGIKSTIIEKRTTTSPLAKAMLLSGRSPEHFRRIGLEEAVLNVAYPVICPSITPVAPTFSAATACLGSGSRHGGR